jgi:hypothetical protein
MATSCRYCSEELYFERNSNGKFVPMEESKREPHSCPNRPSNYSGGYGNSNSGFKNKQAKITLCKYCSNRIRFSTEYKSYNDKFIPLNYEEDEETGELTPHMCSENPYYSGKNISSKKKNRELIT